MKGSLRRREGTRDTWELRVITSSGGQRREKTRTFHGGKREAGRALASFVAEIVEGRHTGDTSTLADLLNRYLDHIAPDKSPSTMKGYRRRVQRRIIPALGKKRLSKLRALDLDNYYRMLRDQGRSASDIRQDHAIIRGALGQAVKWDLTHDNVAMKATPPKQEHHDRHPPTPAVLLAIIDAAEQGTGHPNSPGNPDLACALRLLAATGARRGEVCALQHADFDPLAGTVTIARSVVEAGGQLIIKDPKTDHGRRRVSLDDETLAALKAHVARQRAHAGAAGYELGPTSFLFTPDLGDTPWRPDYVSLAFVRLCRRLGARIRLHDLRHAHATYMLDGGISVRNVAGRLGQDPTTTMRTYAHVLEQGDRAAAALAGRLLTGPST